MIGLVWRLAQDKPNAPLTLLEIGSWCGASALAWGEAIEFYFGGRGRIACVDAWESYHDPQANADGWASSIEEALKGDQAYDVFRHNMTFMPPGIALEIHRGRSQTILPALPHGSFDVVYIDGDHTYDAVAADIANAVPLIRDGGVICGDDLELQGDECDLGAAAHLPTTDYVYDRRREAWFHPGVTKAVWQTFGRVSAWEGFWAMQRVTSGWRPMSLAGMPMRLPGYVPPSQLAELKMFLMREGLL